MLIGIAGNRGSGKDTVAKMVQYFLSGVEEIMSYQMWEMGGLHFNTYLTSKKSVVVAKFADKLKEVTALITGCDRWDLEKEDFKNSSIGPEWKRWVLEYQLFIGKKEKLIFASDADRQDFLQKNPVRNYKKYEEELTYRTFLRELATEGGRDAVHPNIWIIPTMRELPPNKSVMFADMRFLAEAEAIRHYSGGDCMFIHVNRENNPIHVDGDTHRTERDMRDMMSFNLYLENDGGLDDLLDKVRTSMANHPKFQELKKQVS